MKLGQTFLKGKCLSKKEMQKVPIKQQYNSISQDVQIMKGLLFFVFIGEILLKVTLNFMDKLIIFFRA